MYVQGLFTEGVVKPETNEYEYQEYGDFYINSFDTNNDVITTWLINTDTNPSNYSYDAYGNKSGSSDNLPSPYGYNGYYRDSETGLYYLNARYYDPTTQQFTQEDTYWGDGTDLYAYCHFNPVMYSDPTGHISMSEIAELQAKQKAEDAIRAQYAIDNYGKDKSISKKNYNSAVTYVNDYIKSYYIYDRRGLTFNEYKYISTKILRHPNGEIPTKISAKGVEFICNYEGFSSTPYDDGNGNMTIGYGHVIKNGETFTSITKEQALILKSQDLSYFEKSVTGYSIKLGIVWNQNEYDAFVSLAYNSGNSFKGVMDDIISGMDPYKAFSQIIMANGQKSLGLYRRRMDEADMFYNGTYNRTYRQW